MFDDKNFKDLLHSFSFLVANQNVCGLLYTNKSER